MEAEKTLVVADQQVPGVEENIPSSEDTLQQLPLAQLRPPSIAQERGLLADRGHQQPGLTWQSTGVRAGFLPTRSLLALAPRSSARPPLPAAPPHAARLSTNLDMWPHSAPGHPGPAPLW